MVAGSVIDEIVAAKPYTGLELTAQTERGERKLVELMMLHQFRRDLPAVGYEEKRGLGNWYFFVRQGHGLHHGSAIAVNCTGRSSINYVFMSSPEKALDLDELVENAGIIGQLAEFDRSSFGSTIGGYAISAVAASGAAIIPVLNYALGWGLPARSLGVIGLVGVLFGLLGSAVITRGVNNVISKHKESRIKGNLANLGHPENYLYGLAAAEAIYKEIREQKTAGV